MTTLELRYESPFEIPQCNGHKPGKHDPDDTLVYHKSFDQCPLHWNEYSMPDKKIVSWNTWWTWREAFATASNEDDRHYFLTQMLSTVTLENPPEAVRRIPQQRQWTDRDAYYGFIAVAAAFAFILAVCLTFA